MRATEDGPAGAAAALSTSADTAPLSFAIIASRSAVAVLRAGAAVGVAAGAAAGAGALSGSVVGAIGRGPSIRGMAFPPKVRRNKDSARAPARLLRRAPPLHRSGRSISLRGNNRGGEAC